MKRAVWLLLAVFGGWLLLLPALALAVRPHGPDERRAAPTMAGVATVSVEALPAPPVALRVAPAPLFARLPVAPQPHAQPRSAWPRAAEPAPVDTRRRIARVQVRRAVPRLNDAEPPWSAVS